MGEELRDVIDDRWRWADQNDGHKSSLSGGKAQGSVESCIPAGTSSRAAVYAWMDGWGTTWPSHIRVK